MFVFSKAIILKPFKVLQCPITCSCYLLVETWHLVSTLTLVKAELMALVSDTCVGRMYLTKCCYSVCKPFLKHFIYSLIFRERGREGERVGEKLQCVVASHAPPTGDLACNPGMCPDWELNRWPFGLYHCGTPAGAVDLLLYKILIHTQLWSEHGNEHTEFQ